MTNQAMLIEDGDPIRDFSLLKLLLVSMLPTLNHEPNGLEELASTLFQSPELMASHAALSRGLIAHFSDVLRANPEDQQAKQLLQQLLAHDLETVENRMAYSPRGKFNPNAVYWPNPAQEARSLFTEVPFAQVNKFLNKSIPIGSIGSCFAVEIAHRLQSEGYNYVITEQNPDPNTGLSDASAKWGTIYNAPSIRQLVERAFGARELPKILTTLEFNGRRIIDPFREGIFFNSVEEYEASYASHLEAVREAFLRAKVFVLTVGLNEVWYLKQGNYVFSRAPWRFAPSLVEKRTIGVEENIRELQAAIDLWRLHNPEVQFIISVSPVPLHATFKGNDMHVVAANCLSKATLRLAVEEVVKRNQGVHYFPSYETVMYCTQYAWDADQRHVTREAVNNVMRLFDTMFVEEEAVTEKPATAAAIEPVHLMEKKGLNMLMHPDWLGDFSGGTHALGAYLNAFNPADDICLYIWLPSDTPCSIEDAENRVLQAIHDCGQQPDTIPDVVILDGVALRQRDALIDQVQAVIHTGGDAEARAFTIGVAQAKGIPVLRPEQLASLRAAAR